MVRVNVWLTYCLKNGKWTDAKRVNKNCAISHAFFGRALMKVKYIGEVCVVDGDSSTLRAEKLSGFFAAQDAAHATSVQKSSIGGE